MLAIGDFIWIGESEIWCVHFFGVGFLEAKWHFRRSEGDRIESSSPLGSLVLLILPPPFCYSLVFFYSGHGLVPLDGDVFGLLVNHVFRHEYEGVQ